MVFLHETCKFDAWLVGYNKQVQSKYWQLIKNRDWKKYPVVQTIKGADAIIEHTLVAQPDFSNLGNLTQQIETAVLNFIENIEDFLSMNQNQPG